MARPGYGAGIGARPVRGESGQRRAQAPRASISAIVSDRVSCSTRVSAVVLGLYQLFEDLDVPATYVGWHDQSGAPYNDRWRSEDARG